MKHFNFNRRNLHIWHHEKMLYIFILFFVFNIQNTVAQVSKNERVCNNLKNIIAASATDFSPITGENIGGNNYASSAFVYSNDVKIYFNVEMKRQVFEEVMMVYPDSADTQKEKDTLFRRMFNTINNCLPKNEWLLLREKEDDGTEFIHFKNLQARKFMKLLKREKDIALVIYHQNETTQRCLRGNCENGFGTMLYENGDVYEGQYYNSMRIGIGKYVWLDGSMYEGSWISDTMNGYGRYTEAGSGNVQNSYMFQSNFIDVDTTRKDYCVYGDCANGFGLYHYNGGQIYIGYFKNGLQNGLGVFESKEGNYYGNFAQGKFNGDGIYFLPNGTVYRGTFVNGQQQGQGIESVWGEKSIEGKFEDSVLAGAEYSANGIMLKKGQWKDKRFIPTSNSFDEKVLAFSQSLEKVYAERENKWERVKGNRYRRKELMAFECMIQVHEAVGTFIRQEAGKTYVRAVYHTSPMPKDIAVGRYEQLLGFLKQSLNSNWIPSPGENNDTETTANRVFYFKNAYNKESYIALKVVDNMVHIDIF